MPKHSRALAALAVLALAAGSSACGGDDDDDSSATTTTAAGSTTTSGDEATTTSPGESTTTATPAMTTVSVYFLRGEQVGVVRREVTDDGAPATAAVAALLEGPTEDEGALGFATSIPPGTTLNGVVIADGVATVDLSGTYDDGGGTLSMSTRLAEVVFTLTQFPTVAGVLFELDGEPVETFSSEGIVLSGPAGRADFTDATPMILVESPTPGDVVSSPLAITGSNNTFESNVQFRIEDGSGNVLAEGFTTGTGGMGTWGPFEGTLDFDPGAQTEGTVVVFESSAQDGSDINVVEIPVRF